MKTAHMTLLIGVMLVGGGCTSQRYMKPDRLERGLVVVLPGIEGRGPLNQAIADGLDRGGVSWGIEIYDWTAPWGPLYNLRAEARNRREATRLADRINRYRWDHPGRPVVLVGQSGGAAVAVWTAEQLTSQPIEGLILLAPTLSPTYPLQPALMHLERGIVSFYSRRDWVFLGVGTTLAGTMDGMHSQSAGRTGFELVGLSGGPAAGKVQQIPWTSEMAEAGHIGMHLSSGAESFVARYVAPFVLLHRWNAVTVRRVLRGQWLESPDEAASTTQPAP